MTPTEIVGAFGLLLGVIASSAAAVAVFRQRVADARIVALRGDVEDRDKRIEFLEDKEERHVAEAALIQAELKRLGDENSRLWDRTQAIEQLAAHELQATARHAEIVKKLDALAEPRTGN